MVIANASMRVRPLMPRATSPCQTQPPQIPLGIKANEHDQPSNEHNQTGQLFKLWSELAAHLHPKRPPILEFNLHVSPRKPRLCIAANDSCIESYDRAERGEHIFGGVIAAVTVTDPKGRETTVRFTPKGRVS